MRFPRFGSMTALVLAMPFIAALGCGSSTQKHAGSAADAEGSSSGGVKVGQKAPDLTIQTVNGKGKVNLDKLAGKVVLVDFWATWCGPCKESFPNLQEIAKRHQGEVEVVGVSGDEEPDGIEGFAKEQGATFPLGWDQGHTIAQRWKPASMPSSFIVDGTGKVRFTHVGYHPGDEAEIERELVSLLNSKSAPSASSGDKGDAKPTPTQVSEQVATPVANSAPTATAAATPPPKPVKKRGAPTKKKKKK